MKINGKQIAQHILDSLKGQIKKLKKKNITPHLAIIIAGNDPASVAYVRQKELKAKAIGIKTIIYHLPDETPQINLIKTIQRFNNDNNVHGIIVQQPLPQNINTKAVAQFIDLKKDVDGFNSESKFEMPIVMAVSEILKEICSQRVTGPLTDWLKSKEIAIIGKGETGGKPVIAMLEKMKIPFALIDSKTKNPENLTKTADIIISAVGKTNIVKPQMIKKGVVLIGLGISRGKNAKLMGDYDQNEVKNIASFYTPTPGGIGPINVAMLLKNLITAAKN